MKDFIPTVKSLPGNTVIVLHQQGSHGPAYHRRYPDHFKRYTPVCTTADLSRCLQNEIINAYDNSIAYTSYVLAQTISLLSRLSADYNTLMLFVSDHGESLGEKGLYLHAAPYIIAPREQTKVPMLIWLSPANAEALKIDLSCARKTTAPAAVPMTTFFILCSAWAGSTPPNIGKILIFSPRAAKNKTGLFSLSEENLYLRDKKGER